MAEEGMDIKDMFILHAFPSKYGLGLNLIVELIQYEMLWYLVHPYRSFAVHAL